MVCGPSVDKQLLALAVKPSNSANMNGIDRAFLELAGGDPSENYPSDTDEDWVFSLALLLLAIREAAHWNTFCCRSST
jgi:hypothetical protein